MQHRSFSAVRVWIAAALIAPATVVLSGSDWPEWRGPARTGVSTEKGLPEKWSPSGENLAWRVPFGGRSAPVVFGDHLYLQNTSGTRRGAAGAADVLQRRHRQAALGAPLQPVQQRRASASDCLVVPGRRSRDRQCVRDQRRRPAHVAVEGREAAVGALPRRGVRHVDDARRAHVVAGHRSRSGHRQRPDLPVGSACRRRASLPLLRQGLGPDQLGQRAGRTSDRHHLRQSVHRGRERRANVLLRRQRRRDARDQGEHRRADLELESQPARVEHRGARRSATT